MSVDTDFRNGRLNLHFLHVNKKRRGRSCSACHDPHESPQHGLIRSVVPYGKIGWKLPIKFQKLRDGGTCTSGCHAPKRYSRKIPQRAGYVRYPPPYGATNKRQK